MPSSEATWQFKIMFEVISTIVMKLTGPWFPVRKLLEIPRGHIPILLINHDKSQCVSFKTPGFSMDPCPRHRPVEERLIRYLQKREKKRLERGNRDLMLKMWIDMWMYPTNIDSFKLKHIFPTKHGLYHHLTWIPSAKWMLLFNCNMVSKCKM